MKPRDEQKQKVYAIWGRRNEEKDRIARYEEIEPLRWSWCCTDPSRGTDRGENFPGSLTLPTLLSLSNWSHGSFSELSWKSAHMGAWRDQLSSCPVNSSKGLKNKSEEKWVMGWPGSTDLLKVESITYYRLELNERVTSRPPKSTLSGPFMLMHYQWGIYIQTMPPYLLPFCYHYIVFRNNPMHSEYWLMIISHNLFVFIFIL